MPGKTEQLWNLEYWIGQQKIETILYNQPKPICWSESRKRYATGNYSKGKFKITKVET